MWFVEIIQGLVRPIVSISLVAGLLWLVYAGEIDAKTFMGIVGPVIGFHFAGRSRKED